MEKQFGVRVNQRGIHMANRSNTEKNISTTQKISLAHVTALAALFEYQGLTENEKSKARSVYLKTFEECLTKDLFI